MQLKVSCILRQRGKLDEILYNYPAFSFTYNKLKAATMNFLEFLKVPKQFIIPIYQRNYSWTIKQCEQLWNDIKRIALDSESHGHFIGSIVYIESGIYQISDSVHKLLLIDGQQRLTTVSLLLTALSNALKKSEREADISEADISSEKIINYYLFNNLEKHDLRYKILLNRNDKETFLSIIEGSNEYPAVFSHHMVDNYKFFEEKFQNNDQINLNEIYLGIHKLILVDISLDRNYDDPQLIFESLNSTGLDLSQADLIRNYMLMGLGPVEQEKIYSLYWHPLERSFEQDDYAEYFDRFMRDFLTIKTGQIPNKGEIYSNFKLYVTSRKESIDKIVENIRYYSKIYVNLIYDREDDKEIRSAIKDIRDLNVEVSYPFLLEIFDDYSRELISRDELLRVLRLVESYVFRRGICLIPTRGLNKTFTTLSREIDKSNYLESLMAVYNSMELNKEEFILSRTVLESFTDFANQLSKQQKENVKLILALDEGDVLVVADKHRVSQVISNLLNNAIKFTEQGDITISTEKEEKYGKEVIVKVKDSGSGIDPDIISRLFTKFATKSYSGTGLGLFISKIIVETHGGRMWAENNPGKGASFSFTLPIAANRCIS